VANGHSSSFVEEDSGRMGLNGSTIRAEMYCSVMPCVAVELENSSPCSCRRVLQCVAVRGSVL